MKTMLKLLTVLLLVLAGAAAFVYSGVFDVAADKPHWPLTVRVLEAARERAIAVRVRDIEVPDLENAALSLAGGPDYNEMCSGCHLKPGKTESELSLGLYPSPPNLAKADVQHADLAAQRARAARRFWIIKHGLKMTGMPAWGATHDDARIWAMVAFIEKLPRLSPAQYQILTARGEDDPGHDGHHHHRHDD